MAHIGGRGRPHHRPCGCSRHLLQLAPPGRRSLPARTAAARAIAAIALSATHTGGTAPTLAPARSPAPGGRENRSPGAAKRRLPAPTPSWSPGRSLLSLPIGLRSAPTYRSSGPPSRPPGLAPLRPPSASTGTRTSRMPSPTASSSSQSSFSTADKAVPHRGRRRRVRSSFPTADKTGYSQTSPSPSRLNPTAAAAARYSPAVCGILEGFEDVLNPSQRLPAKER